MAELTRSWEDWLHPTGTLFRDDLEEIERILSSPMSKVAWKLQGEEGMRSADAVADSYQEFLEVHGKVRNPARLELEVSEYGLDGESFLAIVGTSSGERGPWYIRVSGSSGNTERCESSVDEVASIFERASQTSWARTHKRMASAISDGWVIAALAGALAAWIGFGSLVTDYPWLATAVALAYFGSAGAWYWLKRRVEANGAWEPPKFDIRFARTQSVVQEPPDILGSHAIPVALAIITGVVFPTIVELVRG